MLKIILVFLSLLTLLSGAESISGIKTMKVDSELSVEGKQCIECHSKTTPVHVNDWKDSLHSHVGVSCIDCHRVKADAPMAAQNCEGVKGTSTFVTPLVSSAKCSHCHPDEAE